MGTVRLRVTGMATRPGPGQEAISLYDVHGRLVSRVPLAPERDGEAFAIWQGKDEAGRIAPAGLYFACLPGPLDEVPLRFVRLRPP
jgi:flagellar hook assembly protein FlgD